MTEEVYVFAQEEDVLISGEICYKDSIDTYYFNIEMTYYLEPIYKIITNSFDIPTHLTYSLYNKKTKCTKITNVRLNPKTKSIIFKSLPDTEMNRLLYGK